MSKKITGWWFYLIFNLLFIAAVWLPRQLFNNPTLLYVLVLMLIFSFVGPPLLARDIKKAHPLIWLAAGLCILAVLVAPSYLQVEYLPYTLPAWIRPAVSGLLILAPSMAVIVIALLVYTGMAKLAKPAANPPKAGSDQPSASYQDPTRPAWIVTSAWALAAALVARLVYNFYWLIVWDSTYDPMDFVWIIPPIYAALFSAVVLTIALPRRGRLVGLYGLVMPALLVGALLLAKQVDYRQLTEAHAAQVSRAIEKYYTREGHYPQKLTELIPRYAFSIASPVIINGTTWCYGSSGAQASDSMPYYRLGYVDRNHWSDPNLFGHLYKSAGAIPDLPPICADVVSTWFITHP